MVLGAGRRGIKIKSKLGHRIKRKLFFCEFKTINILICDSLEKLFSRMQPRNHFIQGLEIARLFIVP